VNAGIEGVSPALVARLAKSERQHKYDHGHVLVLAGGVGQGGAARMSARAALRVGAGLVTLAPPPAAIIENAAQLNAVMLRAVGDAHDLYRVLEDGRITTLLLGPGLGRGERTRGLVSTALASGRAVVLDADALTSFEADSQDLFAALHPACVLTPHAGEFVRLFPEEAAEIRAARKPLEIRQALHRAALRANAVVLLKGALTRIAAPGHVVGEHEATGERAAPWLATAGSGDVLAGIIAGLLARGFSAREAALLGTWLHVEAGRMVGPGLIAEDLPEALPDVMRLYGV